MSWTTSTVIPLVCLTIPGCASHTPLKPPRARILPHTMTIHGETRIDDYDWLRERDNPEVVAYLEAENAYVDSVMKHARPFQEELYREMKSRKGESDLSVPVKYGDYYYYERVVEGKQYPVEYRSKGNPTARPECVLDHNELAEGHAYFRIGSKQVSPDHRFYAFAVDTSGSETYTLRIKDLQTDKVLPEEVSNTYYGLAWANDNRTIFYTTLDAAKRPERVWRHRLGDDPKDDQLVYHEKDKRYRVSVIRTRSGQYILINSSSQLSSEVRFLAAADPMGSFRVVRPRKQGVIYSIDHHDEHFYMLTNDHATNFKLIRIRIAGHADAGAEELIPHRKTVSIENVLAFKRHLAIFERADGLTRIRIRSLLDGTEHLVSFPEAAYEVYVHRGNREFETQRLRFRYSSLVTPLSVFDYDMDLRTRELKKQEEVLGGYAPTQYTSERIYARAIDGTRVPISLVYRTGLKFDGTNPLLLNGYGSYGISMDAFFLSEAVSLLDRGFVYAIAHVRGGGDLGQLWYEDGRLLHKKNSFTDFIACAEHLIAEQYTSPDGLAIAGYSAGGLLVGAVANMRPTLFRVVLAQVPVVDVVTALLDEGVPLTAIQREEYGDPNSIEFYDYMKSYSPYDNVEAKDYPNMLITASFNDPRVPYWEPAKWTAKLRAMKTDNNRVLLKTDLSGAGHLGKSGRFDRMMDEAFNYTFILDSLGIRTQTPTPPNHPATAQIESNDDR